MRALKLFVSKYQITYLGFCHINLEPNKPQLPHLPFAMMYLIEINFYKKNLEVGILIFREDIS